MKRISAALVFALTSCAIGVETESTSTAKAPGLDGFPTGPWRHIESPLFLTTAEIGGRR